MWVGSRLLHAGWDQNWRSIGSESETRNWLPYWINRISGLRNQIATVIATEEWKALWKSEIKLRLDITRMIEDYELMLWAFAMNKSLKSRLFGSEPKLQNRTYYDLLCRICDICGTQKWQIRPKQISQPQFKSLTKRNQSKIRIAKGLAMIPWHVYKGNLHWLLKNNKI